MQYLKGIIDNSYRTNMEVSFGVSTLSLINFVTFIQGYTHTFLAYEHDSLPINDNEAISITVSYLVVLLPIRLQSFATPNDAPYRTPW